MTPQPLAHAFTAALAEGRPAAFELLYDRLSRPMLRVAVAMLGSVEEAEDAIHDVFITLARHRLRLGTVDDLDAYVFASLRHAIWAQKAATAKRREHLQLLARSAAEFHPPPVVQEDWDRQLACLPPEQREVVTLKIDADLTFAQIAQVLGIRPNTAASRYRYAIEKLRQRFEEER